MASRRDRTLTPTPERCEGRSLAALVFLFNGNAFDEARPGPLTDDAARVLRAAGHQVIPLAYPHLNTPSALDAVARRVAALAHGRPVALVGFSAGGSLALRLSAVPSLHVIDVLDEYGPPDARDDLAARNPHPIRGLAPFDKATVALFSGPVNTSAHVVATFGLSDPGVKAAPSAASLRRDLPGVHIYLYRGAHGVPITASRPALEDFLAHL